jgi:hypothetical protein
MSNIDDQIVFRACSANMTEDAEVETMTPDEPNDFDLSEAEILMTYRRDDDVGQ